MVMDSQKVQDEVENNETTIWELMFDAMQDAVFLVNPQRRVVVANAAADQLMGCNLKGLACFLRCTAGRSHPAVALAAM